MSKNKLYPWDKDVGELTQFDWLTAVGQSGPHRDKPTELRCAQELVRFARVDIGLAYMTQLTHSDFVGCHRVNTSKSLSNLVKSGAVIKHKICELPKNVRKLIKRSGRGSAYTLNIEWAAEQFEMRQLTRRQEPKGLKKKRLAKTANRGSNVADTSTTHE